MQFLTVEYNKLDHYFDLMEFCETAEEQNLENNSSIEKLGLNKQGQLFITYSNDKIVATSFCHNFENYYKDTWRVFSRTCTLKGYRAKGFPKRPGLCAATGINVFSLPAQVDYAIKNGAKNLVYTTNVKGYSGSEKLDKHFKKYENICPEYSFIEHKEIYNVEQSVWKLLCKDVVNLKGWFDNLTS